jgi:hypothetical protein
MTPEAAAAAAAARRAAMNEEERQAFLEYHREYGKRNRARIVARQRLWRAERRLIAALGNGDDYLVQKRRYELAKINELIHIFGAW